MSAGNRSSRTPAFDCSYYTGIIAQWDFKKLLPRSFVPGHEPGFLQRFFASCEDVERSEPCLANISTLWKGRSHLDARSEKIVSITQSVDAELFLISHELANYSYENYGKLITLDTGDYFDSFSMSEEEKEFYWPYYIWWLIFCSRKFLPYGKTVFQMFLQNCERHRKLKPLLEKSLSRWQHVHPGFYRIVHKVSGQVYHLADLFDSRKEKVVCVSEEMKREPSDSDLLTGLVLPSASGVYFTVVNPLIIPGTLKDSLVTKLEKFYQEKNRPGQEDFFAEHYPEMLKITIDHLLENNLRRR